MGRQIIFFGDYFFSLYNKQTQKIKDKINRTLGLVRDLEIIPVKFLKHIEGTDIYEIRIRCGKNIFRIFCFFDKENLVVILNGFQKKSQKTPVNEILKALKLKKKYYEEQKK